ncbi:MAG: lysophospholipid acyltransferase family protein [Phycisphaerales bacterium]
MGGVISQETPDTLATVLEDRYSERFFRFFASYVRRMLRRNFHGLRLDPESETLLDELNRYQGPALILGNHPSWWDPLVAIYLTDRYLKQRPMLASMDSAELERFAMFRRMGVFGIDPNDPNSLPALVRFLSIRFEQRPSATFWITPQGRFTDVREPIRLRPGAAAVASQLGSLQPMVLAFGMDYCFWTDRRPELCMRLQRVIPSTRGQNPPSTTDWFRAMTSAMNENQDRLTAMSIQKNPDQWLTLCGIDGQQRINPIYDLWLKLRGRSGGPPPSGSTRA